MSVELNSHGVNKKIKYQILPDEKMKEIGFCGYYYEGTDHEQYSSSWYFIKSIKFPEDKKWRGFSVTFSVYIPKDGSDINILVLDEDFLQPYDYQHILSHDPKHECANIVKEQVEDWMKYLQDNGVISGHEYGEYI